MSMLAERKVKQKWSLNPRGKAWTEDSNKFGQKMLEKMGWSKGKGLGANEDGIVENLKVSYKNDSKGMGFKDRNDQWTEHDTNFNALLQTLSGEKIEESDVKIASLEKKSQSSKVRVHYKKFTRGKDLSRCSEKDLASIFGKRSFKSQPNAEEVEESKETVVENINFTYNSHSMVDYFKKKLPNYGKSNSYVVGSNGVLKKHSESEESETEGRPGFGFPTERKRKSGEGPNGTPKKVKREENGLSNPAFDPLFGHVEVHKHALNPIEEEEDVGEETKKKKKKERVSEDNPGFDANSDTQSSFSNDNFEVKRKKKKEKLPIVLDNPSFDVNSDGQSSVSNDNFEVKRKTKKGADLDFDGSPSGQVKKKNKKKNKEEESVENMDSFEVKRKRKKQGEESLALDNPVFDASNGHQSSLVDSNFEVKRKKKNKEEGVESTNSFEVKRKGKKQDEDESLALDNPVFNSSNGHQSSLIDSNFEVKRKKKNKEEEGVETSNSSEVKRKKKKQEAEESLALDNPVFDASNDHQSSLVDSNFEVKRKQKNKEVEGVESCKSFEVKRKGKKQEKDESLALDNPVFDSSNDHQSSLVDSNFEVKRKKKNKEEEVVETANSCEVKRKKKKQESEDSLALDNPVFDASNDHQTSFVDSNFEVKRKKKKGKNVEPTNGDAGEATPSDDGPVDDPPIGEPSFDLILNVTSTPSVSTPKAAPIRRRKSVRFSDVHEERIIPNEEDIENRNELFDINSRVIANGLKDNVDEFSKKIEGFQAEIENDINEAKDLQFIGEVGDPNGTNEKLPEGTKLKFKYAKFGRTPSFLLRNKSRAKSSYKHLIKGDIVLGFNNTNLHEIAGYGVTKN